MAVLSFIELSNNGELKKSSLESICFAKKINKKVYCFSSNVLDENNIKQTAIYGCNYFIRLNENLDNVTQIEKIVQNYNINYFVFPKSNTSYQYAASLSVKIKFSLINNVVSLPFKEKNNLKIKTSIFSGKAFSHVTLDDDNAIFIINKSSVKLFKYNESIKILDKIESNENDSYRNSLKILNQKSIKGTIPLTEAEIVVSAGRGMKDPGNWKIIEDLASLLDAATACSKPVSDMGWRPHHEHVGQTGIKISPSLYIAIGISGAIQHLAGVGNSKVIVVINNDPEAPFFNSADYGIIGDAFEVVPNLIKLLEKKNG